MKIIQDLLITDDITIVAPHEDIEIFSRLICTRGNILIVGKNVKIMKDAIIRTEVSGDIKIEAINNLYIFGYIDADNIHLKAENIIKGLSQISILLEKYNLPNSDQYSLEKGLRNAAANNNINDLACFITHVDNLDIQDNNPGYRRTALHWAAIKGNQECYDLLIQAGADQTIIDASGKMPLEYTLDSSSMKMFL